MAKTQIAELTPKQKDVYRHLVAEVSESQDGMVTPYLLELEQKQVTVPPKVVEAYSTITIDERAEVVYFVMREVLKTQAM